MSHLVLHLLQLEHSALQKFGSLAHAFIEDLFFVFELPMKEADAQGIPDSQNNLHVIERLTDEIGRATGQGVLFRARSDVGC